ncbi:MAG: hypothetical protein ACRCWJ_22230 [Casimicrobium sp.]
MSWQYARALNAALLSTFAFAIAACSTAPTTQRVASSEPEQTKAVLWVGNSFFYYNNSMHGHVGQLIRGSSMTDKTGHRAVSATISGSGINWHDLEAHFKPNGVGSYSFNAKNEVVFNTFTKPFDVVLMMDCSQCPIHPQLRSVFHEHAKKNSDIARKHGARPAFFMSWAYADAPEMTEQLAAEYTKAGQENNALVVPAGLAFAASLKARPDIALTIADKRHPTLAGTYLAACTVLASLYKTNPEGNTYTAGLDAATAKFLQTVAWQSAQDYAKRK